MILMYFSHMQYLVYFIHTEWTFPVLCILLVKLESELKKKVFFFSFVIKDEKRFKITQ